MAFWVRTNGGQRSVFMMRAIFIEALWKAFAFSLKVVALARGRMIGAGGIFVVASNVILWVIAEGGRRPADCGPEEADGAPGTEVIGPCGV